MIRIRVLLSCILLQSMFAHAEEIRDYYSEPGLNPFSESVNQSFNEHIDPFSGTLQLKYTDLVIPGNGGMDFALNRSYTSLQTNRYPAYSQVGIGWTFHFGRAVISKDHLTDYCTYGDSSIKNPQIEFPDGRREQLVDSSLHTNPVMITRSNWIAECNDAGPGLVVRDTNGTIYTMDVQETFGENITFLTSRIEDLNGNFIALSYNNTNGQMRLSEAHRGNVTLGTNEKIVDFTWADNGPDSVDLVVSANGQQWTYLIRPVEGVIGRSYLTEVIRPDGKKWQYAYVGQVDDPNPTDGVEEDGLGSFSLKDVTYPDGGVISYTYQWIVAAIDRKHVGVQTKAVTNTDATTESWTYQFEPSSVAIYVENIAPGVSGDMYLDKTLITTPDSVLEFHHFGAAKSLIQTGLDENNDPEYGEVTWDSWLIGSKHYEAVRPSLAHVPSNEQYYQWSYRTVSAEAAAPPASWVYDASKVPQLDRLQTVRDGVTYTTDYLNYDVYGQVGTVVEYGNFGHLGNRQTERVFSVDIDAWLFRTASESIYKQGDAEPLTITQYQYDAVGNLLSQDVNGVVSTFSYHPDGTLWTTTDALNRTRTYSNYYRNIAQREELPEGVVTLRTVNPTGTLASETDGEGNTKYYSYDNLNRILAIDFPLGDDVSFSYLSSSSQMQRGSLQETLYFDGFGREISSTLTDSLNVISITKDKTLDYLGRVVFESYPNDSLGRSYDYDELGRMTRRTNADNSFTSWLYNGATVNVTNERGHVTVKQYGSYGAPDNGRHLVTTETPDGAVTAIWRNPIDLITQITQVDAAQLGWARTFNYNERNHLVSETRPEAGDIVYGRDVLGRLTTRQVGTSGVTTHVYDQLDRVTTVDYPASTPDVSTTYDLNSRVKTVSNANAVVTYDYDANGNLRSETSSINGVDYVLSYSYDSIDNLAVVTYPSGRTIDYAPDAFARPTQAMPYLTNVTHHPSGHAKKITYANGYTTDIMLDDRLMTSRILTGGISDASYTYDDVGNVTSITDAVLPAASKSMTYDELNRLLTATGEGYSKSYQYDEWGNILTDGDATDAQSYNYSSLRLSSTSDAGVGTTFFDYDTYGNITAYRNWWSGSYQKRQEFVFNDAGHLVTAQRNFPATALHTYAYDGRGHRVSKATAAEILIYSYDHNGVLRGEYDQDIASGREYFYLGANQIASVRENRAPEVIVDAVSEAFGGQSFYPDASLSRDDEGDALTFSWEQTSGPSGSFWYQSTATPKFFVPEVTETTALTLEVTVTDSYGTSSTKQLTLNVIPYFPPVAGVVAVPRYVGWGSELLLDGSPSYDPDNQQLSYHWERTSTQEGGIEGGFIPISNSDAAIATLNIPESFGRHLIEYRLTVTDASGLVDSEIVRFTVIDPSSDDDSDGLPDLWEYEHFGSIHLHDGNDDPDGDGFTNLQEYRDGMDPNVQAPPPEAPTGLEATAGDSIVALSWDKTANAQQYMLYWSTAPSFNHADAIALGDYVVQSKNYYEHHQLVNGQTLYYQVRASNGTGASTVSPELSATPRHSDWQADVSSFASAVATSASGDVIVVYEDDSSGTSKLMARWLSASDGWSTAVTLDGSYIGSTYEGFSNVAVDTDGSNNALVAWVSNGKLYSSTYESDSLTWAPSIELTSYDPAYRSVLAVTGVRYSYRRGAVVWLQEASIDAQTWKPSVLSSSYLPVVDLWSPVQVHSAPINFESYSSSYPVIDMNRDGDYAIAWEGSEPCTQTINDYLCAAFVGAYSDTSYSVGTTFGLEQSYSAAKTDPILDLEVKNDDDLSLIWKGIDGDLISLRVYDPNIESLRSISMFTMESPKGRTVYSGGHVERDNYNNDTDFTWIDDGLWFKTESGYLKNQGLEGQVTSSEVIETSFHIDANGTRFITWLAATGELWTSMIGPTSTAWSHQLHASNITSFTTSSSDYGQLAINATDSSGVSTLHRYAPTVVTNQPPTIVTNGNQTVPAGTLVTLDASQSTDDGYITSYAWTQTAGDTVSLTNANTATATFVSPSNAEPSVLNFSVLVEDNEGAQSSSSVQIDVLEVGASGDVTAPTTSISSTRYTSKGKASFDITLSADEPSTTYFRVTGNVEWMTGGSVGTQYQVYTGPITVNLTKSGTATFEYYSVDSSNNTEATQTEILQ